MSIEAEKQIIGSIILDDSCIYELYNILEPNMFEGQFLGNIYNEMLALYEIGEHINPIELAQRLESETMTREEVLSDIVQIVSNTQSSATVKSCANEVIRDYKARTVRDLFGRIDLKPKSIDASIADVIGRLEELQENKERRSKSLKQIAEENENNYFKMKSRDSMRLGFEKLDDCLGGLEAGDVTVVGARPSVGKSAFVTQVITQVAKQGFRVGYFNLEMGETQVYERIISSASGIELGRIRRAINPLGGEMQKFLYANDQIKKLDIVVSSGSKTAGEIKAESRHQKFDLIVIDYLQIIMSDKSYGNRVSEVGYISKAIKGLAMELKIPIILLSQLSRSVEQRDDHEPQMSDLRESGDIEQDASNIIFIWNMNDDENCTFKGIKVDKNRQGNKCKHGMTFEGSTMCFTESELDFNAFKDLARKTGGFRNAGKEDTPFG